MTTWAKQEVTEEQWRVAKETFEKWKKEYYLGEQPWVVIGKDGDILREQPNAVCLFPLHYNWKCEKEQSPVLFQYIYNKNNNATNKEINSFVSWSVRNPFVSPYICKHTKKQREEAGIPISLVDVPANAPLVVSTHVRMMWDSGNSQEIENFLKIKKIRPKWSNTVCLVVANSISGYIGNITVGLRSKGHSLFSGYATLKSIQDYANREFDHTKFDSKKFNLSNPLKGIGIALMFERYDDDATFNEILRKAINNKGIKGEDKYGTPYYHSKCFEELIDRIYSVIKKGE